MHIMNNRAKKLTTQNIENRTNIENIVSQIEPAGIEPGTSFKFIYPGLGHWHVATLLQRARFISYIMIIALTVNVRS